MLFKMSDEKGTTVEPTVVIATSEASDGSKKSCLTRKSLLIAVVSLLITGLVVTAVLVGIRIVTDGNVEIQKYTLQANGLTQNVSTDNNVVSYHVIKDGVEAWIIHDFDRELQVAKVLFDGKTNCYVTPLNRSMAADASSIPTTAPDMTNDKSSIQSILYEVVPQQISDISYLGKKASAMCQNIPTYHAVRDCGKPTDNTGLAVNNNTDHRSKRTPAYCATCNRYNCLCACGCCNMVCAWFANNQCILSYINGWWYCTYYYYSGYLYAIYSLSPNVFGQPPCYFNGVKYLP